MAFKRWALAAALTAAGCGGTATVKPDPPVDDAKKLELAVKNLESPDPTQRAIAVGTLGMSGSAAKPHLDALKKLEKDPNKDVRERVKEAIAKIEKGS